MKMIFFPATIIIFLCVCDKIKIATNEQLLILVVEIKTINDDGNVRIDKIGSMFLTLNQIEIN